MGVGMATRLNPGLHGLSPFFEEHILPCIADESSGRFGFEGV